MARLTKIQVEHLCQRLQDKKRKLLSATTAYKQRLSVMKELYALQKESNNTLIVNASADEVKAAILTSVKEDGNCYGTAATRITPYLMKTQGWKTGPGAAIKLLKKQIAKLDTRVDREEQKLQKQVTELIDSAIFAGTGEDVLKLINAFMAK